jgi:ectoine hydroxylase-related dioxygenase (phytanoyl-CoA dioxygenase family)
MVEKFCPRSFDFEDLTIQRDSGPGSQGRGVTDHYRECGYAVIRGVFSEAEIRDLARAFDRVHELALSHARSYRDRNTFFQLARDRNLGRIVRFAQWPSYIEPTLAEFRTHPKMFHILKPFLGPDIKQIINQLHWKTPGAERVSFGFHQDIRFRRPRSSYRRPESSYLQTVIAVDRHRKENGAIAILPYSHRLGELEFPGTGRVLDRTLSEEELTTMQLNCGSLVHLELDPGDVALWSLYTVHGSGENSSDIDRRAYINGYVRATDCDRGEWAFRGGEPCALGEPQLVHYEDLHTRPGPYYVD